VVFLGKVYYGDKVKEKAFILFEMDIQKIVEQELANLNLDLINKLRENDSLIHFTRNFIINLLCAEISLDLSYENIHKSFCKNNNIENEEKFKKYLKLKGMKIQDHKRNLINSKKILTIANKKFLKKAETDFLNKKNLLNLYSFDIIETFQSDLAHEIYFQLESNEVNIEKLKLKEISEKSLYKISSVSLINLLNTDSLFSEKIINLKVGEFCEPFKFNKNWVILFLKEKKEAEFNEEIKSKMVLSLFEEWINLLSVSSISQFLV